MRPSLMGKLILAAALMGLAPASAQVVVRRVWVPVYRPWGWGWGYGYDPFYYGPPVVYHPNQGEVKLETKVKDAQVFIDGGYAGRARELKTMWLQQGSHNLEIRAPEGERYTQRIYVMAGKTLHVRPAFG